MYTLLFDAIHPPYLFFLYPEKDVKFLLNSREIFFIFITQQIILRKNIFRIHFIWTSIILISYIATSRFTATIIIVKNIWSPYLIRKESMFSNTGRTVIRFT